MTLRELVRRRIEDLMEPVKDAILSGSPTDMHNYHMLVGKYEGYRRALQEIEPLLEDDGAADIGR